MFTGLEGHTPRQIAYFVLDVRAAAERHARMFGSGPYFLAEQVPYATCLYRGKPARYDTTAAFGQWGDIQLEFMQQNSPGDSIATDLFPPESGRFGLHHMSYIVDNPATIIDSATQAGYPIALQATLRNGIEIFILDTVALNGHMIELFPAQPAIIEFFDFVRDQARNFDGRDVIRPVAFD